MKLKSNQHSIFENTTTQSTTVRICLLNQVPSKLPHLVTWRANREWTIWGDSSRIKSHLITQLLRSKSPNTSSLSKLKAIKAETIGQSIQIHRINRCKIISREAHLQIKVASGSSPTTITIQRWRVSLQAQEEWMKNNGLSVRTNLEVKVTTLAIRAEQGNSYVQKYLISSRRWGKWIHF